MYSVIVIIEKYLNDPFLIYLKKNLVNIMSYVMQMQATSVPRPGQIQERYGISPESFNDIQRRLERNTAPQVRPEEPRTRVMEQPRPQPQGQMTLQESELLLKMKEALQYQATQFERFRDLTERKFTTISKDLLDVTMQLKEAHTVIAKIKDKEEVAVARERMQRYQQGDAPPVDRPIDRNGVAPSQIKIASIFNCAGKKF